MPKPIMTINGSGMHTNQSLFRKGKNLFYDCDNRISQSAQYYIGGILKYVKEMTSVFNQYVNSYKRLVPGYEAPCYITWAFRNRSDLIRIPNAQTENSHRIELRSPDSSCNPYLAFALMLKAGVEGSTNKINPPKPEQENVYHLSDKERKDKGIECLPSSLNQALKLTEKSQLVKEVFGEHLFNKFIENKKLHIAEYEDSFTNKSDIGQLKISEYEIEKLLPLL
jgi:glutamine synthetase